jgi:SAM-dependent methyltransferase
MGGLSDETHFDLEKDQMAQVFIDIFDALGVSLSSTSIFEIGCGSGGILYTLQEKGASCLGFDLDPHRVEEGKKRGINIHCADALDANVAIPASDYVILSNVLEHLYEPKEFLRKLKAKFLTSNQRLIIDVPNVAMLQYYGEQTSDFFHVSHLWYFSPKTLRDMLLEAGFNVEYLFVRGAALSAICVIDSEATNTNQAYIETLYALNISNRRNK